MKIEVKKAAEEDLKKLDISSWSAWSCGISEFDWEYDSDERCYILEGKAIIKTDLENSVIIEKGDLVLFPKGLKCSWKVVAAIRKIYRFE